MFNSRKVIKLNLICALCDNMGIGLNGSIPWHLKKEMKYFAQMTTATKDNNKRNVVIMGRKTWESIPLKFKPLPNRLNIIISKTLKEVDDEAVLIYDSLDKAITDLMEEPLSNEVEGIWIIGGAKLYEEAMNSPFCDRLYLTRVQGEFKCDTYFPKIPQCFHETFEENVPTEIQEENGISYRYTILQRN